MDPGNILAHRGWWESANEKNSEKAITRALAAGFGLETDFRDRNGEVVIAHDPPSGSQLMSARHLFQQYNRLGSRARLALNIKADGLVNKLRDGLSGSGIGIEQVFAFDTSVPDGLSYIASGFPWYTRTSEYETSPSALRESSGVWVDNFQGQFDQVAAAQLMLSQGLRVALVSDELHGRDQVNQWHRLKGAGLHKSPNFEICTDFPIQAQEFFSDKD